jgi:hypothetical protein
MANYLDEAFDDGMGNNADLVVEEGDDLIQLRVWGVTDEEADPDNPPTRVVMTIGEALTLIAKTTEAIAAAIANQE